MLVMIVAAVCGLASAAGTAYAAPSPPFHQCPAVGADASCALLVYITKSGAVGVAGDPSQGPYDSVEDTLIGVQNDSSASIASIPIAATSGKDLFGFDGDGICSFGISGCPFGPTGYEGPGTSFTAISADRTKGTVNFAPPIQPGGHAYFALEEALATVPPFDLNPGPPAPAGHHYIALGDSFSSGEGNPDFLPGTATDADKCHRSNAAYPELLANDPRLNVISHESRACSGATRQDVLFGKYGEDGQLNHIDAKTDLVTIGVGGDDLGFGQVLAHCVTGFGPSVLHTHASADCKNLPDTNPDSGKKTNLDGHENALIADLAKDSPTLCQTSAGFVTCSPRLASLYYAIAQSAAPNARIFVLLYPHLFSTTPIKGGCTAGSTGKVSENNVAWLNSGVDKADAQIISEVNVARAAGVNVKAVDPRPLFDNGGSASPGGHGVCTKDPWIHGITLRAGDPRPYSFHPNVAGQQAFERAIAAAAGP